MASNDMDQLVRWERLGGTWALLASAAGKVEIALLTCSAGEQVGLLQSEEPDLVSYVSTGDVSTAAEG
jgi:hypothetical protein